MSIILSGRSGDEAHYLSEFPEASDRVLVAARDGGETAKPMQFWMRRF